ncbi:MAG TPA: ABC transporter permease, partial [Gemmatimonadaceae bacterium]|nr:ABC transporter permease [Gemmatimonadaceae bacterium]
MISLIAFRNIIYRPWRSALLFFGYGIGVAVMIVLLSVGEALLTQARDEKLVGGGEITVLPQGLDVEVMKTGGVGGLFFSIDQARFIYDQLLASPRLSRSVKAVAPQIDGRLLYLRTRSGNEYAIRGSGEIPSRTLAVRGSLNVKSGTWRDDDGDRRWSNPTLVELRHDIDHFHLPNDSTANRDTWAEWHYFNVLSPDRKRWAFISFIVGGDVTSDKWGGSVTITLREQGKESRKFESLIPRQRVQFSTSAADLRLGESSVTVLPNGDYKLIAAARGARGKLDLNLLVHPAPRAYFPGASIGTEGFVSGYTVPALRANASGSICVEAACERFEDAQAYHDHNWGVWRGVTWDWGASRAGTYTILYGRVIAPDSRREQPLFLYLVDSLGFRAVMRPATITYTDGRIAKVAGRDLRVPSRAV